MHKSKIDQYEDNLVELRRLRSQEYDPLAERRVLRVMDELWETMTLDERRRFSEKNTLSWPPPRQDKERKQ